MQVTHTNAGSANKVIDLDKLVGISAEIPGPNISIDRITLGPDWLEFEF